MSDRTMMTTPLSHGFLAVSDQDAAWLNNGGLPEWGRECLVEHDGKWWWLSRVTLTSAEMESMGLKRNWSWSIRETNWRM